MKTFAVYLSNSEKPEIVKGFEAVLKRTKEGMTVSIKQGVKSKTTFKGVVIFTELSEAIKVQ